MPPILPPPKSKRAHAPTSSVHAPLSMGRSTTTSMPRPPPMVVRGPPPNIVRLSASNQVIRPPNYSNLAPVVYPNIPPPVMPSTNGAYGMSNKQWEYHPPTAPSTGYNQVNPNIPPWQSSTNPYLPIVNSQMPVTPQVLPNQVAANPNITEDNAKVINALLQSGLLQTLTNQVQLAQPEEKSNSEPAQKKSRFSDMPPPGGEQTVEGQTKALVIERKEGIVNPEKAVEKYLSEKERKSLRTTKLEVKALEADVTVEYYDKIKAITDSKEVNNVALEFARKEYAKKLNKKLPVKVKGKGNHSCFICKKQYEKSEKLKEHYKSDFHKQLEEIYDVKKEQARLILNDKLLRPPVAGLDQEMISISWAEYEMNVKPLETDLNTYVLSIYESIMKPYWPKPLSKYYCRICDYQEFQSDDDLYHHEQTLEHEDREDSYEQAFCLFCQVHLVDANKMESHVASAQHIKVKELMQRTKISAIEHWHSVNNLSVPPELTEEKHQFVSELEKKVKAKRERLLKQKQEQIEAKLEKAKNRKKEDQKNKEAEAGKKSSLLRTISEALVENEKPKLPESADVLKGLVNTLPTEDSWFDPVYGFMCVACQKFLPNVIEQKRHANSVQHLTFVQQFKMKAFGMIKYDDKYSWQIKVKMAQE